MFFFGKCEKDAGAAVIKEMSGKLLTRQLGNTAAFAAGVENTSLGTVALTVAAEQTRKGVSGAENG